MFIQLQVFWDVTPCRWDCSCRLSEYPSTFFFRLLHYMTLSTQAVACVYIYIYIYIYMLHCRQLRCRAYQEVCWRHLQKNTVHRLSSLCYSHSRVEFPNGFLGHENRFTAFGINPVTVQYSYSRGCAVWAVCVKSHIYAPKCKSLQFLKTECQKLRLY